MLQRRRLLNSRGGGSGNRLGNPQRQRARPGGKRRRLDRIRRMEVLPPFKRVHAAPSRRSREPDRAGWAVITCGHCKDKHASVAEVRACASRGSAAPRPKPTRTAKRASRIRQAEDFGRAQVKPYSASQKQAEANRRRRNPTDGEKAVAEYFKRTMVPFQREYIIDGFVADFYIPSIRTVIEVDGGIHQYQLESDRRRDDWFRANHYKVVRITNTDACSSPELLEQAADLRTARKKSKSKRNSSVSRLTSAGRPPSKRDGTDGPVDKVKSRSGPKPSKKADTKGVEGQASARTPAAEPNPKPPPRSVGAPPKRRHACRSCGKRFVAPIAPVPKCRSCDGGSGVVCRNKRCEQLLPPSRTSGPCDACLRRDLDIRESRKGGLQSYWDNGRTKGYG
jgi:very-short-patch-repair endonuclease